MAYLNNKGIADAQILHGTRQSAQIKQTWSHYILSVNISAINKYGPPPANDF